MKTISIEYIKWLISELMAINKHNLDEIEFTEYGDVLDISDETRNEFGLIGLNNVDFIMYDFYLKDKNENSGDHTG